MARLSRLSRVEHAVQKALGTLNNYSSEVTLYVKVTINAPIKITISTKDLPSVEDATKDIENYLDGNEGPKDIASLCQKAVKRGDAHSMLSSDDISTSLDMNSIYKEVTKKVKAGKYTYTITDTEKV